MEDLNRITELAVTKLKKHGADKAHVEATAREVHELNVEAGRLSLLRTTFDHGVSMRAIVGQKQAVQSGNRFSDGAIADLSKETVATASTSAADEAYDIAPTQPAQKFISGPEQGDLDLLVTRTEEFLQQAKQRFPKVIFEALSVQFVSRRSVVANSNGVHFELFQNDYQLSTLFTAKSGKKASSFNHTGFSSGEFDSPMMVRSGVEELLQQIEEQTESRPMEGKFLGDVILTPHCAPSFIGGFTSYLGTGALMKGQSVYQNKLGEQVAVPEFNLRAKPTSLEFSQPHYVTGDGFVSRDTDIVENGVLKTYLVGQYGAKKLKLQRTPCDDTHHVIDPGSTPLAKLVGSVKRGLLLCRFSGGYPASNGDVTGVAKNSFYIEDGEIRYPVMESMVSANIPQMLLNIRGISKESICFGSSTLPWLRIGEVTISGK